MRSWGRQAGEGASRGDNGRPGGAPGEASCGQTCWQPAGRGEGTALSAPSLAAVPARDPRRGRGDPERGGWGGAEDSGAEHAARLPHSRRPDLPPAGPQEPQTPRLFPRIRAPVPPPQSAKTQMKCAVSCRRGSPGRAAATARHACCERCARLGYPGCACKGGRRASEPAPRPASLCRVLGIDGSVAAF